MAATRSVKVTVFSKELVETAVDVIRKVCPRAELKFLSTKNVSYDSATQPASTGAPKLSDEVIKSLQDAEVLISEPWLVFPIANKLPNLKWMQGTWAGIDGVYKCCDPTTQLPPKLIYTRLGGVLTKQMSQYVMSYILAIERHHGQFQKAQEDKKWQKAELSMESRSAFPKRLPYRGIYYRQLSGLTIGILGVGDIGSEVARVVKTFGMKTWGLVNRELPKDKRSPNIDEYRLVSDLQELLANCDYLCNVLPSTSKTIGLLSGDVLSHCKKKPVFINIGRGDVTTDDSIVNAIKNGWISKAVLDVFEKEPLPDDSPLWTMPEVTITPHCSGLTLDYSVAEIFGENYQRYINGQPLKYVIEDWGRGY